MNTNDVKRFTVITIPRAVQGLLLAMWSTHASSQTPAPLQEWQYSAGLILAPLFQPELPEFRTVLGAALETQPVYDGTRRYVLRGGPVISLQYRDIAFASTGEGIGFNFLRGPQYEAGIALSYDLGRKQKYDLSNLQGMGDIKPAPVGKLYASVVLSKEIPVVVRVDARQFVGGAQGAVGDVGLYLPVPGSSERFVMFIGPSITVATAHYQQTLYGVTTEQSLASGHSVYRINGAGRTAAGFGFSGTTFLTKHWLINLDGALRRISGSPGKSPVVETKSQRELAVSLNYRFTSN